MLSTRQYLCIISFPAFFSLFTGCLCIKLERIVVPRAARLGDDVTLVCKYNLENDILYALKWHLDDFEFYRFAPRDKPPKQIFPLTSIDVDMDSSHNGTAVLRNVQFTASGRYKCEISAEGSFRTLQREADMSVSVNGSTSVRQSNIGLLLICCSVALLLFRPKSIYQC